MAAEQAELALARIEAALARIEAASARPLPANGGLEARHEQLRGAVAQALHQLDSLIGGQAT